MSRSYLKYERDQWRMFCDVCFAHDDDTFDQAPELLPFYRAGWFIGTYLDACPSCVTANKLPPCGPNLVVLEEAEDSL